MNYITSVERIGIQKGRQEGWQEGRQEAMQELAIKLLDEEILSEEKIAAMTGLSPAIMRALHQKAMTD